MEGEVDRADAVGRPRRWWLPSALLGFVALAAALGWTLSGLGDPDEPPTKIVADDQPTIRIFFQPNVSAHDIEAVEDDLEADPVVARFTFTDQDEALEEFRKMFAHDPEMLEDISAGILPPSFSVFVDGGDDAALALVARIEERPGIREIIFPQDPADQQAEPNAFPTGDFDAVVFLDPAATQADIDEVGDELASNGLVEIVDFLDQEEALEEFQVLFADDEALIEQTTAEVLPTSYRVSFRGDPDAAESNLCGLVGDAAVVRVSFGPSARRCPAA